MPFYLININIYKYNYMKSKKKENLMFPFDESKHKNVDLLKGKYRALVNNMSD